VWTVAAALGVASVVRASSVAFTTLKLVGALYLVWLGIQAIRTAGHAIGHSDAAAVGSRRPITARAGFRQGLLSDLANPKIGIFFTSLLPQFVDPGHAVLVPFLLLGAIFVTMTILWLIAYCLVAARLAQMLQRPRVKRVLDRITGVVLIALGLRLAAEHR
jgi:threonine/homoserine/homoserine lactone efflux protein